MYVHINVMYMCIHMLGMYVCMCNPHTYLLIKGKWLIEGLMGELEVDTYTYIRIIRTYICLNIV